MFTTTNKTKTQNTLDFYSTMNLTYKVFYIIIYTSFLHYHYTIQIFMVCLITSSAYFVK